MTDKVGELQLVDKKVLHIVINKKSADEMRVFCIYDELSHGIKLICSKLYF